MWNRETWSKILGWLRKVRMNRRPKRSWSTVHYTKPKLEWLEQRIVPVNNACTFTAVAGAWDVAANWAPIGGVPTMPDDSGTDTATIAAGASCTLNQSDEVKIAGLAVAGSLTVQSDITVLPGGSLPGGTGTTAVTATGLLTVTTPGIIGVSSKLETSTLLTAASTSTNFALNDGTVEVDNSGILSGTTTITGGMFDAKNIDAFSGAVVALNGPGSIGGTGQMEAGINATITFTPFSSWVILPDSAAGSAFKEGKFFVDGPLAVNSDFTPFADITLDPSGTIGGTGSLDEWHEFTWLGGILGVAGGTTIEPSSEFKTDGADDKLLSSDITNISAFTELGGGGTLWLDPGVTFDNAAGTVTLTLPSISNNDPFTGSGTFINDGDGILDAQSPASSPTLIQCDFTNVGKLDVANGDNLILDNSSLNWAQDLDGTLNLEGDLTLWGIISSSLGLVQNAGGGTLKIGDPDNSLGVLNLSQGGEFGGNVEVTEVGKLTSDDTVYNNGKLTIDLPDTSSNGAFLSSYQQTSDGTLSLQAMGPGFYSSLAVTGNAQLSGILDIDFLLGPPASSSAFTVVTAGSIGAHFDTVPADMTASYTSTTATVTQN